MDRSLDTLHPSFRPVVFEFLARLTEAGIPVLIVNTRRTTEEQLGLLLAKRSWVEKSKHQEGLAIDVAPYEVYLSVGPDKLAWDAEDPLWQRIGKIGESLGLVWGGRWGGQAGGRAKPDMGHFEEKGWPDAESAKA